MKTLNTLLTEASESKSFVPQRNTLTNSLKELKGLIGNTINTTVGIANETLSITNDIVSVVPVIIQGSKETVTLTGLFSRAVVLNSILTTEQIEIYHSLTTSQRIAFRKALTEKGAHDLVSALSQLFSEEENNNPTKEIIQ